MKRIVRERKNLYLILSIFIVCIFSITIAYSVLSTILKIEGNAQVVASNWNIRLDNVKLVSGSSGDVPKISNFTTVSFSTTLNKPGDYYTFTIDVVNDGSIDAMIDSVVKTPTLTAEQLKYINYVIEYENGDSINNRQLVEKNSFVRLKIKVEYRKDITVSELPSSATTLNMSFILVYVQAAESNTVVVENNGTSKLNLISGDLNTPGSEICIENECFYLISNDGINVAMLAKYGLHVGNVVTVYDYSNNNIVVESLSDSSGIQNSTVRGFVTSEDGDLILPFVGTIEFSKNNYWGDVSSTAYVYNSNSSVYEYVENYKKILLNKGVVVEEARLLSYDETEILGCRRDSCENAPQWIYGMTYWLGNADNEYTFFINNIGYRGTVSYDLNNGAVVRPVIVVPLSEF